MNYFLRTSSALGRQARRYMGAQRGRMMFGTDTLSDNGYSIPPGLDDYFALQTIECAGLTPPEILTAATLENARLFMIDGRVGTVEVGKAAELLLDADRLASTTAFDAIHTVIPRERPNPSGVLDGAEARR